MERLENKRRVRDPPLPLPVGRYNVEHPTNGAQSRAVNLFAVVVVDLPYAVFRDYLDEDLFYINWMNFLFRKKMVSNF
jgi:hypothetical protein